MHTIGKHLIDLDVLFKVIETETRTATRAIMVLKVGELIESPNTRLEWFNRYQATVEREKKGVEGEA